jgi:uncharacterized protein with predicted RNA binding PUA domain
LTHIRLDSETKIGHHIDALFGNGIFERLKVNHATGSFRFEHSRRTGRIKYFFIKDRLAGTIRTDGGIALTIIGANELLKTGKFLENCVKPIAEAVPFVKNGHSLFCKHVEWCGSNVKVGSEAVVIDNSCEVIAVGKAIIGAAHMKSYGQGVAVKIREGLKSPSTTTYSNDARRQSGDETNVGQDGS